MGRNRKYFTEKEKKVAQRRWQMEHYERNKEKLREKAKKRYNKKKKEKLDNDRKRGLYGER